MTTSNCKNDNLPLLKEFQIEPGSPGLGLSPAYLYHVAEEDRYGYHMEVQTVRDYKRWHQLWLPVPVARIGPVRFKEMYEQDLYRKGEVEPEEVDQLVREIVTRKYKYMVQPRRSRWRKGTKRMRDLYGDDWNKTVWTDPTKRRKAVDSYWGRYWMYQAEYVMGLGCTQKERWESKREREVQERTAPVSRYGVVRVGDKYKYEEKPKRYHSWAEGTGSGRLGGWGGSWDLNVKLWYPTDARVHTRPASPKPEKLIHYHLYQYAQITPSVRPVLDTRTVKVAPLRNLTYCTYFISERTFALLEFCREAMSWPSTQPIFLSEVPVPVQYEAIAAVDVNNWRPGWWREQRVQELYEWIRDPQYVSVKKNFRAWFRRHLRVRKGRLRRWSGPFGSR